MEKNHPLFASKVRKKFNRLNKALSLGDAVRTMDGGIGIFQGISTHRNPSVITILLYSVDSKFADLVGLKNLPKEIIVRGKRVPILSSVSEKPHIQFQDYSGGYRGKNYYSFHGDY